MKIGIIYGSTMGNTQGVAEQIKQLLGDLADEPVDVAEFEVDDLAKYDAVLLGIPTWHVGEMQDDWQDAAEKFNSPLLSGKKVALFGCGDQAGYPDTFGDALGLLWDIIQPCGAELIGRWPTAGYNFEASAGVRDGSFLGLMCDNDYEPERTDERVEQWVNQLRAELGVGSPA